MIGIEIVQTSLFDALALFAHIFEEDEAARTELLRLVAQVRNKPLWCPRQDSNLRPTL